MTMTVNQLKPVRMSGIILLFLHLSVKGDKTFGSLTLITSFTCRRLVVKDKLRNRDTNIWILKNHKTKAHSFEKFTHAETCKVKYLHPTNQN